MTRDTPLTGFNGEEKWAGSLMGNLITKAELARKAGRTPSAVSMALKRTALSKALVGTKIDVGHPEAVRFVQNGQSENREAYLREHGENPTPYAPTPEEIETTLAMLPPEIRNLVHMSLNDLIEMFGTSKAMVDFLNAVKILENIHGKRLESAEKEGRLVSRDLVEKYVIGPIDNAHKRLLTDGARTISKQVHTMALAGRSAEDCEKYVNGRLTSFIKNAKAKSSKALEDAGKK